MPEILVVVVRSQFAKLFLGMRAVNAAASRWRNWSARKTPTVEALEMRVEVALENHNAEAPEIQFFRADENNA